MGVDELEEGICTINEVSTTGEEDVFFGLFCVLGVLGFLMTLSIFIGNGDALLSSNNLFYFLDLFC